MSNRKNDVPNWFLWIYENGFLIATTILIVFLVAIIVAAFSINERLGDIDERLTYSPATGYQDPDLTRFKSDEFPIDSIEVEKSVYVPVYSHVYHLGGRPYLLESMLSIRNVSMTKPIYVRSVRYYDTNGNLAKTFVNEIIKLSPLKTIEFLVTQRDTTGGSGANFIVEWLARENVDEPMIEGIMVGTAGTQGICFRSQGQTVSNAKPSK